jgi:hypothetical protein
MIHRLEPCLDQLIWWLIDGLIKCVLHSQETLGVMILENYVSIRHLNLELLSQLLVILNPMVS